MKEPRRRHWVPLLLTIAVVAVACDGSAAPSTTSDGVLAPTTEPTVATTDPAPTTTEAQEDTTTTGSVVDEAEGSGCNPGAEDLPDGTWYGFVISSDADTMEFDLACWFTGEAAAQAAAEDGEESPPPNDYYVRNANETTRTLAVAEDAEVDWYPNLGDPTSEDTIDYPGWLTAIAEREFMPGVWVEVSDGEVSQISEQWVP